ncbi:MAG: amino acid racemase [Nanoarchaeota archaeon]|nr:amino acid racemase [Nanoarchaeota archaeon]
MVKCIGIIGGLGPKTAFQFAQNLNDRITSVTKIQPDLLLENLPVSDEQLERMTKGEPCPEIPKLMLDSVRKLNSAGVDLIVIPCNTVHVFIGPLRQASTTPILSIIEETARVCKEKKLKTVGILASNTTIKQNLYTDELAKFGIKTVIPLKKEQNKINEIIFRINRDNSTIEDKKFLLEITRSLRDHDAEAVLLACTDLQQLISSKDTTVPLLDTLAILEEAVFNFSMEK